ncbi:MAG: hypothetical protein N3E37_03090 [Candidatus Micrarchaeota archaeon]|nr:hypothetical protein [Candidatus Micrarchaeota archaeon]
MSTRDKALIKVKEPTCLIKPGKVFSSEVKELIKKIFDDNKVEMS